MLLGLALAGCTGNNEPAAPVSSGFDASWIREVVQAPASFSSRVEANREGWIAFHQNDWPGAVGAGGDPAARAHAALAEFYAVLQLANTSAWSRLSERWQSRGLSNAALVHEFFLAGSWVAADGPADASVLGSGAGKERWALHAQVRAGTLDASALLPLATQPVVTENVEGTERHHYDPWIFATLAIVEANASQANPARETSLFSGHLVSDKGSENPKQLPVRREPADHGEAAVADADACRDMIRSMDGELSAWEAQLSGSASPEGRALLDDLRLVDATRSRALVSLAIDAANEKRPGCALALTQLALDHESPRAISPVNSPTLFAVTAQSLLALGRSREALDAVEVLAPHYPAVAALDETIGTLVVLDGLDRRGESRE